MATEIERKFLVKGDAWKTMGESKPYRQGYLSIQEDLSVRVRIAGAHAVLTIKGAADGIARKEFEYEIPVDDADEMLGSLCIQPLIEKTRYRLNLGRHVWEVDEFLGDNLGLVVAEVELHSPHEAIDLPDWIGEEVSHDPRYLNSNLVKWPYKNWSTDSTPSAPITP